jgi:hypothetical protein
MGQVVHPTVAQGAVDTHTHTHTHTQSEGRGRLCKLVISVCVCVLARISHNLVDMMMPASRAEARDGFLLTLQERKPQ